MSKTGRQKEMEKQQQKERLPSIRQQIEMRDSIVADLQMTDKDLELAMEDLNASLPNEKKKFDSDRFSTRLRQLLNTVDRKIKLSYDAGFRDNETYTLRTLINNPDQLKELTEEYNEIKKEKEAEQEKIEEELKKAEKEGEVSEIVVPSAST